MERSPRMYMKEGELNVRYDKDSMFHAPPLSTFLVCRLLLACLLSKQEGTRCEALEETEEHSWFVVKHYQEEHVGAGMQTCCLKSKTIDAFGAGAGESVVTPNTLKRIKLHLKLSANAHSFYFHIFLNGTLFFYCVLPSCIVFCCGGRRPLGIMSTRRSESQVAFALKICTRAQSR
ncbi:hypothetical protein JOB18_011864 [Solea senegalensis]|uniref:Uncharacterized protein n=1 Tax=Solea senegalensis TaxID=28829 RepID=A0AAV6Q342_SOLSE|nr:hypothetical protein JOB18_011864 [Solea senegalensis]